MATKKSSSAPPKAAEAVATIHANAGVIAVAGAPDRVWYSFGATLQPVQYESVRFDMGLASDVRAGETAEQAFVRIASLIHDGAHQRIQQIRGSSVIDVPEEAAPKPKPKRKR